MSNEIFDKILDKNLEKGICHTCGALSPHALIYCKSCGGTYCSHSHTIAEAMLICRDLSFNRQVVEVRQVGAFMWPISAVAIRPDYFAAVYKRHITPFSEIDFTKHIIGRVGIEIINNAKADSQP